MALSAQLDRTRKIGAEYECAIPIIGAGDGRAVQDTVANILSNNGIRACSRPYQHSPIPTGCDICIEQDSSITGEQRYQGVRWAQIEVKTRILDGIDDWERVVPPTLEILRYCGARVNTSTGHHLHFGFDEINDDVRHVRSLWNLFHRFDAVLFGLLAPSRRNNTYCRPMPSGTKLLHGANSKRELRRRLSGYDRYQALNLTHLFDDAPHIELRHHHGTLDVTKARMWLRLSLALVRHSVGGQSNGTQGKRQVWQSPEISKFGRSEASRHGRGNRKLRPVDQPAQNPCDVFQRRKRGERG